MGTLALGSLGLLLFFGSPLFARNAGRWMGEIPDPVGAARVLQGIGVALMATALLVRPHDPATAAFPPSPDDIGRAEVRYVAGGSVREAALRELGRPVTIPGAVARPVD
ncbi:MAG TPA: hypothetical protein VGR37_22775 [Longimicrobiaceae bacterium]|nr:hypothetical protein [Longimicrobiaceae bacterium]